MHTPDPTIPRNPASFTAILFDAGPGPWHPPQRIEVGVEWTPIPGTGVAVRAPRFDSARLAALTTDDGARRAAREAVDLRYVRRMVAECAALCPEALS